MSVYYFRLLQTTAMTVAQAISMQERLLNCRVRKKLAEGRGRAREKIEVAITSVSQFNLRENETDLAVGTPCCQSKTLTGPASYVHSQKGEFPASSVLSGTQNHTYGDLIALDRSVGIQAWPNILVLS